MTLTVEQIAEYWADQSRKGCIDAFECALKEAYQSGREFQRNSDRSICLFHGSKELANVIDHNTSDDGYNADGMS